MDVRMILIQHLLLIITMMALWKLVHLGALERVFPIALVSIKPLW